MIFYDNNDHSNHAGKTWERTSVGRVPVGIDTTQTEFDAIGETGGAKTHKHLTTMGSDGNQFFMRTDYPYGREVVASVNRTLTVQTNQAVAPTSAEYTSTVSTLQPYQVFAFWKRTV